MPESQDRDLQSGPEVEKRLPPRRVVLTGLPAYAELHCITNFSFQRGASHPHELVERAYQLGYTALAITDECSVAGVVQALIGLRDYKDFIKEYEESHPGDERANPAFRLIYGSEFVFPECRLVALARDLQGWGNLCEFITAARKLAVKGEYTVGWEISDFRLLQGCEIIYIPRSRPHELQDESCDDATRDPLELEALCTHLEQTRRLLGAYLWLGVELLRDMDDALRLSTLQQAGERLGIPLAAAGDVHMHKRSRKRLQDVITAVREGRTVDDCGLALQPNAERHLRPRAALAGLYPQELLANTLKLAALCRFELESIKYNYPMETVPAHETPLQTLRRLTLKGAWVRYPQGPKPEHLRVIEHELATIADLKYEMYFLTVDDIVRFARSKGILCQGRGSAANSIVCYCLGITEISPELTSMLFERFMSRARNEPPDIDVDFEHQRREEVIQYIYNKYGRDRAAIAAVVVRYRSRMAIRDVGKALGVNEQLVDAFAKDHFWFDKDILTDHLLQVAHELGIEENPFRLANWMELAWEIRAFPRHLSQHVGGFVLTQDKLTRLVPVENASMVDRSIIQWEKDDLEAMGLLKVDVLALGMLSALRRCLDLHNAWRGRQWVMQHVPREDPQVYDMICKADTVGVFQVESRAQMSMLPRLKPRCYYDLVVEVAIVRPGPIQGGMVHPYLKRRRNPELVTYPKEALKEALARTLGVPIFQEQVMQIAIVAAGFTPEEADKLRRSMAAWKHDGHVSIFHQRLVDGMVANGYEKDFAESIFKQIEGFGEYGFPESHAASFALLVYLSCWFKHYEPACFLAALLNSQPMGFYTPSQLIQDARRHDVEVRPVDVTLSEVDCTIEPLDGSNGALDESPHGASHEAHDAAAAPGQGNTLQPCVRLGLRMVGTLSTAGAARIVQARVEAPFTTVEDMALRAGLDMKDMNALAAADALSSLAGHRRQQVWAATAQRRAPGLLRDAPVNEELLHLPQAPEGDDIVFDYAATGFTLRRHPLALLRGRLARMDLLTAQQLHPLPDNTLARACGIVNMRQRPPTAKGTMFVTLEDETGTVNIIVWSHLVDEYRDALLRSRLMAVEGIWQRDVDSGGKVRNLLAQKIKDLSPMLGQLAERGSRSRDFH
ncbi:MAG: error-prone DNA polymerase [Bdellovibrionales bacterium]|nr:error-prone DNA polymerase [Ramlibacter sp.]